LKIIDRARSAYRAFVAGQATVNPWDLTWGHDQSEYSPAEYGNYIAQSNAVYTCAQRRARPLAALPIALYRGGAEKTLIERGPLNDLLAKVNPYWTMNRLIEMTELSLCLWGSCYWFLERGQSGRQPPQEIWWAKSPQVRVVPHPDNYISHFVYQSAHGAPDIEFQPSEVIWLRYSNPVDQFSGLSPLAAARLSADAANAAMKSNRNLFVNGMQMGGFIMPEQADLTYTKEQAQQLESDLAGRFRGVDKAHRWAVLRFKANLQSMNVTPKDAEFLGLLNLALEDIARAYGVPIDLVGGQRTYQNVREARRDFWSTTLLPECQFIASELTEQLLPMFPGAADMIEFDIAGVEELRVNETETWARAEGQIKVGAITVNEWRVDNGLDPVEWGDTPPAKAPAPLPALPEEPAPTEPPVRGLRSVRILDYGSPEHTRLFQRFVRRSEPFEAELGRVVTDLFQRQQDSVVEKLRAGRSARAWPDELWDMPKWLKAFRQSVRPVLRKIAEFFGQEALDDLSIGLTFDVNNPAVVRFLKGRAQRFAEFVNETTWAQLKGSLQEGIDGGENMTQLADRVESVMGDRIKSSKELIARTEVNGAANGGTLESWKQSGVVTTKTWLSSQDSRVRPDHVEAHNQTVGIDEDFEVGGATGPGPGMMGEADQDCNCRCSMTAEVD
jgi:HK97 family phage portal protein